MPLIAASKRCCVVCTRIFNCINQAVKDVRPAGPSYPILWSHRHIFPTAFLPGTPVEIRTLVLQDFDQMLKTRLDVIRAELNLEDLERCTSNGSAESEAPSSDGEDGRRRYANIKAVL
jgi:hypothetical protein